MALRGALGKSTRESENDREWNVFCIISCVRAIFDALYSVESTTCRTGRRERASVLNLAILHAAWLRNNANIDWRSGSQREVLPPSLISSSSCCSSSSSRCSRCIHAKTSISCCDPGQGQRGTSISYTAVVPSQSSRGSVRHVRCLPIQTKLSN